MSFDRIIGQEKVKARLNFFLEGHKKSSLSPHLLFVAPRGCGKTLIAQTYAANLLNSEGKKRSLAVINCSTLTRLKSFVNDVILPYVEGKEITVLFDEASEIPVDIRTALLTMLNPNKENKNTFLYGDYEFVIDFKKVTFLFATTEGHKVSPSLIDRLERIDLEDYSTQNLATIVQNNISCKIADSVIEEISQVLRGNARKATQMANHINLYLATSTKKSFDMDEWKDFSKKMGILPLGLSPLELKIMQVLAEKPETTLTNLSAKMHMTRESLQRDLEIYLQKLNLVEITPLGRKLTIKGRNYLLSIKA
jgi:Holliday junction DNA helicase RuvB